MPHERDLAVFLVGLAVLLGSARVMGEIARRLRFPAVTGELLAGVLVGPTVLGRVAPGSMRLLFPPGPPATMLAGFTLLSSVMLLTVAGLEVDLPMVMRRRREAALTSLGGVLMPLALGIGLAWLLPARYMVDPSQRWLFALFLGTALSISAMPVIAKTLLDLGFLRTNLGMLVMASAMLDDLIGWLLFSLIVGPMHGHGASWPRLVGRVAGVAVFVALVLGPGRRVFDQLLGALERDRMSAAGRVLSLLFVSAVLGAALTQAIGIHAVFGAFIVGVAVGASPRLRRDTRSVTHEFVSNIFAPVFFAAVGLRVDFIAAFDPPLVAAVLAVACVAKVAGCTLGAHAGGLGWRKALGTGFAMNSRGAMEIILALIALEAGLIRPRLFVALVVMALVTSMISGPMVSKLLRARRSTDMAALLEEGAIVPALHARSAEQAVRELAEALTEGTPLDGRALADTVVEDESVLHAGLSDGIALAHTRIDGLARPMLALGRSPNGLDFNAHDGVPARIVFLLLMPRQEAHRLLDLHMSIVYLVATPEQREALLAAADRAEILDALRANRHRFRRTLSIPAPQPA